MIKNEWDRKNIDEKYQKSIFYLGKVCRKCGSVEDLEFDHIDPKTKKFNITSGFHYSWKKLLIELDKCQLLCRNCHKIKTLQYIGKAEHGSFNMYTRYKCRCDLCKLNWNEACRRWKNKNRSLVQ